MRKTPKKQTNDPCLKSVLKLIQTQLTPIQEVTICYVKVILDKTHALKRHQATLAKFRKTIPNKITTAKILLLQGAPSISPRVHELKSPLLTQMH
jgi:hypothetical protein